MNNIKLSKPQTAIWRSKKRFKVILAGRRFGKTLLALAWLLTKASEKKNATCWYVAPTYSMAKTIAWRQLKLLLTGHQFKSNEAELSIELENGSILQLKSGENPDALRGSSLSAVVMDESAFMVKEAWTDAISPATSDQEAPVMFISSPPTSYNWLTDLYSAAKFDEDFAEDWDAFEFTTADGGNVSDAEIERARKQLDAKTFNREYLARMETMGGRVISEFDRHTHVTESIDVPRSDITEIWAGIDFNVTPVTAVIAVKAADQIHIIDEVYLEDSNTYELATEIRNRYGKYCRVNAYPDPAGRQRKSSAGIGVTDFSILESFGFYVYAPKSTRSVQDGINNVQAAFRTASGHASMFVHPRCKHLILSLERFTYKDGSAIPNKTNGYDHMVDALRYLVSVERPILQAVPKFDIKFMVA